MLIAPMPLVLMSIEHCALHLSRVKFNVYNEDCLNPVDHPLTPCFEVQSHVGPNLISRLGNLRRMWKYIQGLGAAIATVDQVV